MPRRTWRFTGVVNGGRAILFAVCALGCSSGPAPAPTPAGVAPTKDGGLGAQDGSAPRDGGGDASTSVADAAPPAMEAAVAYEAEAPPVDPCDASACPPGVWQNVTPPGIDLNPQDTCGIAYLSADPLRPSDLYAGIAGAIWKSSDYGLTWAAIPSATPDVGDYFLRVAPSPGQATLYTSSSSGSDFYKSTDGGASWTLYPYAGSTLGQTFYSVDIDPYDANHLIAGFHEIAGLAESTDGGQTWRDIPAARSATAPSGATMADGESWYPFFIDTGDAAGTRGRWLTLPQPSGGAVGTWLTTDEGATWSQVQTNEHPHGNSQLFQNHGVVYMPGIYGSMNGVPQGNGGLYRSADFGVTWAYMGNMHEQGVVYGTPNNIYSQYAWAVCDNGNVDQSTAMRASQPGTAFSTWDLSSTGMTNGPGSAAVTFDGTYSVIVTANWNAGLWRYVEPLP